MAGLTGRMSTVVKAKVSKLLDRAEDPAETLDYSYSKQVEQLQNVKKGIADVVTAKKRLQLQETSLQQQVVKLDTQARQAVSELEAAGTFEDLTALGSGEDDIDRQLKSLSSKSAVDDDLAKMKGELGAGSSPAPDQIAAPSEPAGTESGA
jgi:phage shock protein A